MSSIRKTWWAALVLSAAVVGCTSEEPATTPSVPIPPPAPAGTKPEVKAEPAKPEIKAEPGKPLPKKDDAATDLPKIEAPKIEPPKTESPKADASKLSADELAEIKNLPAAEQDVAIKQMSCPISDEHLGSMGTPVKVSADGKTVYLCCKGCKKDFDADPKAAFAKLAKK